MFMTKGNLINNTKTRRKGSMLQDSLSKIKYFLVLAVLLIIPIRAMAGDGIFDELIDQTDTGADRLIYAFDTVGRETYIQVTNTSDSTVSIHVQVFEASADCFEFDFDECLTPGDTIVWNVETDFPGSPDLSDANGFVAISNDDEGLCSAGPSNSLIGMFRIIDDSGYEYRTNAAASEDRTSFDELYDVLNFNDVNGNNLSDVIGITYVDIDSNTVFASNGIATLFGDINDPAQILIFDGNENANSCSPIIFACTDNYGIDNSIPSSQGNNVVCNTSKLSDSNDSGWLFMPYITKVCFNSDGEDVDCPEDPIYFVGFLGLNNGDGSGSMDSWISVRDELLQIEPPSAGTAE